MLETHLQEKEKGAKRMQEVTSFGPGQHQGIFTTEENELEIEEYWQWEYELEQKLFRTISRLDSEKFVAVRQSLAPNSLGMFSGPNKSSSVQEVKDRLNYFIRLYQNANRLLYDRAFSYKKVLEEYFQEAEVAYNLERQLLVGISEKERQKVPFVQGLRFLPRTLNTGELGKHLEQVLYSKAGDFKTALALNGLIGSLRVNNPSEILSFAKSIVDVTDIKGVTKDGLFLYDCKNEKLLYEFSEVKGFTTFEEWKAVEDERVAREQEEAERAEREAEQAKRFESQQSLRKQYRISDEESEQFRQRVWELLRDKFSVETKNRYYGSLMEQAEDGTLGPKSLVEWASMLETKKAQHSALAYCVKKAEGEFGAALRSDGFLYKAVGEESVPEEFDNPFAKLNILLEGKQEEAEDESVSDNEKEDLKERILATEEEAHDRMQLGNITAEELDAMGLDGDGFWKNEEEARACGAWEDDQSWKSFSPFGVQEEEEQESALELLDKGPAKAILGATQQLTQEFMQALMKVSNKDAVNLAIPEAVTVIETALGALKVLDAELLGMSAEGDKARYVRENENGVLVSQLKARRLEEFQSKEFLRVGYFGSSLREPTYEYRDSFKSSANKKVLDELQALGGLESPVAPITLFEELCGSCTVAQKELFEHMWKVVRNLWENGTLVYSSDAGALVESYNLGLR